MNLPDIKLELQTDVNDVKPETTQLMYNLLDIEGTHFLGNCLILWECQNSPFLIWESPSLKLYPPRSPQYDQNNLLTIN